MAQVCFHLEGSHQELRPILPTLTTTAVQSLVKKHACSTEPSPSLVWIIHKIRSVGYHHVLCVPSVVWSGYLVHRGRCGWQVIGRVTRCAATIEMPAAQKATRVSQCPDSINECLPKKRHPTVSLSAVTCHDSLGDPSYLCMYQLPTSNRCRTQATSEPSAAAPAISIQLTMSPDSDTGKQT